MKIYLPELKKSLDEIKAEVDRITSFPADAEKPEVTEVASRSRVIEIAVTGDAPERTLKELANRIKDDLASMPEISYVQVTGVRRQRRSWSRRNTLTSWSMPSLSSWKEAIARSASLVARRSTWLSDSVWLR